VAAGRGETVNQAVCARTRRRGKHVGRHLLKATCRPEHFRLLYTMNASPALQNPGKPSRAKHNSNHRKQRRKVAKNLSNSNDNAHSTDCRSAAASNLASSTERPKRLPDRINQPVASSSGVEEGIAKKKTARGRPNRPWKPWAKLSLSEIENIADRRGNSGRGFEQ
jgi:hypothetical protein